MLCLTPVILLILTALGFMETINPDPDSIFWGPAALLTAVLGWVFYIGWLINL